MAIPTFSFGAEPQTKEGVDNETGYIPKSLHIHDQKKEYEQFKKQLIERKRN
jgi:hypothetical protein